MKASPLVSIIMPAFNAERFVGVAIDSILNQTYTNWELLVCDDASSDNTFKVIQKYAIRNEKIIVFQNAHNQKQIATRNFLIGKCKGDLITFQDADDWSLPSRIKLQVDAFVIDTELTICGTYAQYYNEEGSTPTLRKHPSITDHQIKEMIKVKNQFCGASIMVKRDNLFKVGMYREYFSGIGNEDYDLTSRLVEIGKAGNIPEYMYCVRQSSRSTSRQIISPIQLIGSDIIKHLIKQRETSPDLVDQKNSEGLKLLEDQLLKPFILDRSLIHRKSADISWYNKNIANYYISCYRAVCGNPFVLINWKYLITATARVLFVKLTKFKTSNR